MRTGVAALLLALGTAAPARRAPVPGATHATTIPLSITTADGPRRFRVEQALTPAAQEQGLMFRRHMAAEHGMIFPMSPPRPASFWMKNTYIPLDILFIGPDRRIVQVAARATPLSLATIDCYQPVAAVLELGGGIAERRGIAVGDRVDW